MHTHDLYGRIYALSGERPQAIFRTGLKVGTSEMPVYPRCDLMVDADIRRKALDLLGKGPIVHEACHGTDFVGETLERALVDSIQREAFLAMDYTARRFGKPQVDADIGRRGRGGGSLCRGLVVVLHLGDRRPAAQRRRPVRE